MKTNTKGLGIKIKDFNVKSLMPSAPNHSDLYPKYPALEVSLVIEGVSAPVANAVRRTMAGEMLVKGLDCELQDIETDDDYIIHEMMRNRIRMIPLQQSVKVGTVFTLHYVNKSKERVDVKTKELLPPSEYKNFAAFNQNTTLFNINGEKYCKITATVTENYAYVSGYGTYVLAVNAVSLPADRALMDTPSSIADCHEWELRFLTNNTLAPKIILKNAIEDIISRLNAIDLTFISSGKVHTLSIENESNTIGKMLTKTIITLNPDIEYIVINEEPNRSLNLRIVSDNPAAVLKNAIDHLIQTFRIMLTFT